MKLLLHQAGASSNEKSKIIKTIELAEPTLTFIASSLRDEPDPAIIVLIFHTLKAKQIGLEKFIDASDRLKVL